MFIMPRQILIFHLRFVLPDLLADGLPLSVPLSLRAGMKTDRSIGSLPEP